MKNTHRYNQYAFSVFAPSKMLYRGGPEKTSGAVATLKASKEMAKEYTNSANQLKKQAENLDKSNEYAGLEEMETGAGSKYVNGLKASIASQLKAFWKHVNLIEMTKDERKIQFESLVLSLNRQLDDAPQAMNEKANQLYSQKENVANMYYTSTFMNDRLPEMARDLVGSLKEKLPKETADMVVEWGFQAAQDNPVRIADLILVKGAIVRDPNNPNKFIVNEKNPKVKKYQASIKKYMKEALDREVTRRKMLPEAGARYLVGKAKNENPKSKAALDALAQKIAKRIKNGLAPVHLTLSSMTSVEGRGNDRLSRRRAASQKAAIGKLLAKYVGKDWQKKVKITVIHEQIQPKLKAIDFPKERRDLFRKGVKNVADMGARDFLRNSIADINNIKNPQARLARILEVLAGTADGKAVLREYNDYMALVIRGKSVQAELFLRKKAKHINKSYVLNYLHKTVGRSRSTEVKLMTPELFVDNTNNTLIKGLKGSGTKFMYIIRAGAPKTELRISMLGRYEGNITLKINSKDRKITLTSSLSGSHTFDANNPKKLLKSVQNYVDTAYMVAVRNYKEKARTAVASKSEKLDDLSTTMASLYPGYNVKTIKGEIIINEVTSGYPRREKLVMRLKPNADASRYIAYGPDGKRKGEYSLAQITGGKMDKMLA